MLLTPQEVYPKVRILLKTRLTIFWDSGKVLLASNEGRATRKRRKPGGLGKVKKADWCLTVSSELGYVHKAP
jgi:hypothetical protein